LIYFVDDARLSMDGCMLMLELAGIESIAIPTAQQALDKLIAAPFGPEDIVLIDLALPAGPRATERLAPSRENEWGLATGISLAKLLLETDPSKFSGRIAIFSQSHHFARGHHEWLRKERVAFIQKSIDLDLVAEIKLLIAALEDRDA
jgi:hypothetical protein